MKYELSQNTITAIAKANELDVTTATELAIQMRDALAKDIRERREGKG